MGLQTSDDATEKNPSQMHSVAWVLVNSSCSRVDNQDQPSHQQRGALRTQCSFKMSHTQKATSQGSLPTGGPSTIRSTETGEALMAGCWYQMTAELSSGKKGVSADSCMATQMFFIGWCAAMTEASYELGRFPPQLPPLLLSLSPSSQDPPFLEPKSHQHTHLKDL